MTKYLQITFLVLLISCSQENGDQSVTSATRVKDSLQKKELVYTGSQYLNKSRYNYILKWFKTDSIHFLITDEDSVSFEEMWGQSKKINDSIYYIKCDKIIYHTGLADYGDIQNRFRFMCDKSLIGNAFKITYHDNSAQLYKINSTDNSFKINKKKFNKTNPYIKINFGYINPFTKDTLELYSAYNSISSFSCDKYFMDLYVILNGNKLKTVNYWAGEMLSFELISIR